MTNRTLFCPFDSLAERLLCKLSISLKVSSPLLAWSIVLRALILLHSLVLIQRFAGVLMDVNMLAAFPAASVLSTHLRVPSNCRLLTRPTGEILRKLDPQLHQTFALSISFSAILVLRASFSCNLAISFSVSSRLNFSSRVCSFSCSFKDFSYKSRTCLTLDVFENTEVLLILVLSLCDYMLNSSIGSDLDSFLCSWLSFAF